MLRAAVAILTVIANPAAAIAQTGSVIRVVPATRSAPPDEGRPPAEPAPETPMNQTSRPDAATAPSRASPIRPEDQGAAPARPGRLALRRAGVMAEQPQAGASSPASTAARLPRPRPAPVVATVGTKVDDGPRVLPWVTLGASAALAVVGAVLASEAASGLSGQDFELEVRNGVATLPDSFEDAQSQVINTTIASTALLSAAAAGALLSLILLFEDA